ncbi:hypothetical protein VKT23_012723 [Stygiomarasmius scandens]|uniref:Uncharacterized protein n=1 Tax=Marasmiellus scandens TaxID=2682957 RepID=A0ABR1J5I7_9AGAR
MGRANLWQDTYSKHLFRHKHGYALLNPEPSRIGEELEPHLEALYAEGIRVGDVGLISDSGDFISLFNIFKPSDAPVNTVHGVPHGFQPLEYRRNLLFSTNGYHLPNTWLCSKNNQELKLDAQGTALAPGMPLWPGFGVQFQFFRSEGAILLLTEGARRVDYRGLPDIRDYAMKHAESWYRYLTDQVRMDAYNGSLYVITGYDRTCCYENLSFQSSSQETSISFRFASPLLPNGDFGRLGFSCSSISDQELRRGASSPEHHLHNLSPFIRGFKIMLRQGLRLKSTVKVVDVNKASPKDVMFKGQDFRTSPLIPSLNLGILSRNSSSQSQPLSSLSESASSLQQGSPSSASSNKESELGLANPDSVTTCDSSNRFPSPDSDTSSERGSSILESDSEYLSNPFYHPSDIINGQMLQMKFHMITEDACVHLQMKSENHSSTSWSTDTQTIVQSTPSDPKQFAETNQNQNQPQPETISETPDAVSYIEQMSTQSTTSLSSSIVHISQEIYDEKPQGMISPANIGNEETIPRPHLSKPKYIIQHIKRKTKNIQCIFKQLHKRMNRRNDEFPREVTSSPDNYYKEYRKCEKY